MQLKRNPGHFHYLETSQAEIFMVLWCVALSARASFAKSLASLVSLFFFFFFFLVFFSPFPFLFIVVLGMVLLFSAATFDWQIGENLVAVRRMFHSIRNENIQQMHICFLLTIFFLLLLSALLPYVLRSHTSFLFKLLCQTIM